MLGSFFQLAHDERVWETSVMAVTKGLSGWLPRVFWPRAWWNWLSKQRIETCFTFNIVFKSVVTENGSAASSGTRRTVVTQRLSDTEKEL